MTIANFYAYPGTAHKSLQGRQAESMRTGFRDKKMRHLNIPIPRNLSLKDLWVGRENPALVSPPAFTIATFERRTAVGPAPYVGQPYAYTWDAWVDDYGRWVADTAVERVEYHEKIYPQSPDLL